MLNCHRLCSEINASLDIFKCWELINSRASVSVVTKKSRSILKSLKEIEADSTTPRVLEVDPLPTAIFLRVGSTITPSFSTHRRKIRLRTAPLSKGACY